METKSAIGSLSALAQETRLAIFRLLVEAGTEGLAAGAIAERLDIPASSLSFHLAELTRAGLIAQRRESRPFPAERDRPTTSSPAPPPNSGPG